MAYDPMAMLDEFAQYAETVTGMKKQLVELGWSDDVAEKMVLAMFMNAANT